MSNYIPPFLLKGCVTHLLINERGMGRTIGASCYDSDEFAAIVNGYEQSIMRVYFGDHHRSDNKLEFKKWYRGYRMRTNLTAIGVV